MPGLEVGPMKYKAVMFDLDGTLLDTLEDIADSMNSVLSHLGFRTHPVEAYKYFIGDGMEKLIERTLPESERSRANQDRILPLLKEQYEQRWRSKTEPYEGIFDLLRTLSKMGAKTTVFSNKPDEATRMAINHFFTDSPFEVVRGARNDTPRKPNPEGALIIADQMNIAPKDFLYAGDTSTDMQTAEAAGMFAVGVSWGFREEEELIAHGARVVINHPLDLLKLFDVPE